MDKNQEGDSQGPMTASKKTSVVTFRIDDSYNRALREEAEEKRISVNTLANHILGDYLEWKRYMDKFGHITLTRETYKMMINLISEKDLIKLAIEIAQKRPREFIIFKWKEVSLENVVSFIRMFCYSNGFGKYDYIKNKNNHTFSIRHDFGKKGSVYLKTFFETLIQSILDKPCQSLITDNGITFSFCD